LGVLYPAWATAKAVHNDELGSKEGKLWLSYWVIYGTLATINWFFGFILHRLPFYYLFQCLLTIWLYNRKTRGAEFINETLISPFLKRYGQVIEKHAEQAKETIKQNISKDQ